MLLVPYCTLPWESLNKAYQHFPYLVLLEMLTLLYAV